MFYRLAFKNVTKSVRDYAVYFLTLMFGVCLFYLFNSIDAQTAMLEISKSQKSILKMLTQAIGYVSVFISVILGFLVVYANGFLMKRRKKELGVYLTLGMPKSRISAVMVLETFLIGLLSLAVGLVAGVFLSQGMSVVTAKLFEANLSQFIFTFSRRAFWKTLVYFGVIFAVVIIFNVVSVSHLKLVDLLGAGRKNQKLPVRHLWISVAVFAVSVACLTTAYILIERNGMLQINGEFLASLILGCAGTLLFFFSLSGFLLRVVQANRGLYLKNLNMFVLRQFNSKINTTFLSVSVICIMLLISIGTLSTGMGMSNVLSKSLKEGTPYDISLVSLSKGDIREKLEKNGMDFSRWASGTAQVSRYDSGVSLRILLPMKSLPEEVKNSSEKMGRITLSAVSLADFNRAAQLQGKPTLQLKDGRYAVGCNFDKLLPAYREMLQSGVKLKINGVTLSPGTLQVQTENLSDSGGKELGTLILPGKLLSGKSPLKSVLNIQYRPGIDEAKFLKELKAANRRGKTPVFTENEMLVKTELYQETGGFRILVSYLALYIGLVFLIAAAAVLALQQLSEASDNAERYGLLRKLGAEESMVDHALLIQIALYFFLPLSLAAVHSIVGIHVANRLIADVGHMDILGNIVMTAAIFLVVYGAYFLATYWGSRSMIRQKEIYRRTE